MIKIADYCIRCGLCIDLHPELFEYDFEKDEIILKPAAFKEERLDEMKSMAKDCAVAAIVITKTEGENN